MTIEWEVIEPGSEWEVVEPPPAKRDAGSWLGTLLSRDGVRLAAQGATLGAADEIEAALRSLGSETYDDALKAVRDDVAAAREKPGALAIEMGSGILVPGLGAARSVTAAPTIWNAVRHGAGLGAAAGFLGAEGSTDPNAGVLDHFAERADNAAVGAALGGVTGAVLPAAGNAVKAIAQPIKARLGIGDDKFARKALADALSDEAHASGRNTNDVLRELEQAGLPLALANNQAINKLAHRAGEHSPVARRQLADLVAETEGGAGARVERALDDAMGHESAGDTAQLLTEARRANASRGYADLFEQNSVHDMSAVVSTERPTMRAAIQRANRWLEDSGGLAINDPGAMTPRQIDYTARALDDAVDRAFRSGSHEHGARLAEQRDAFLRAANRQVPGYRETRAMYREDSDAIRALDAGRAVNLKDGARTDEFARSLDALDPWARRQARLGVLQNLRDSVRNTAEAPNVIRGVSESPARAQNLADIVTPRVDEMAPELGDHTRRALEAVPQVFEREARAVRGAQALRQGMPDYEGGLRAALAGVDPASVATQPKASLTRIAARYALDDMNKRRAALVAGLLRSDDWQGSLAVVRAQLARRGVTPAEWATRANGAVAALSAHVSGYRPVEH